MSLLSGMGIMLIVLAFYLTMQNPDIALVEQVQEEKKKAEAANEAKSTFLSHMSHEIRTPMNAVVGMTELMLRTDVTTEQREYLVNIKNSGNALVSIINDILDLTKIESGKMELTEDDYEVAPMLKDIRMIIENRIGDKAISLVYEIDEKLPKWMRGDALRIRQVIINLLNNAVKFTEEGYVKLKIDVLSESESEVEIKISVSDTGQGIRKEDLKRLFEAFEQVDTERNRGKEGTGLGLAISSDLICLMGGKLEVQSVYEEGSDFYFTIKQKRAVTEEADTVKEDDREFTAPGARVLVVDDSQINLKMAVGLLKPLRMQVDTAESGQQALQMVQETEYDIIFMDHMMPGMDGIEATKRMRQLPVKYLEEVPIIAFTANAMKEAEKSFYEAGMNGFIPKPIETEQLFKSVRRFLPEDLLVYETSGSIPFVASESEKQYELKLDGIDVQEGVKSAGSTDFYMEILGDFYLLIDMKSLKIEKCMADELWRDYTVEVHALKTSARMIGAMELSKEFARLEQLGNEESAEEIREETPKVLAHYRSYKEVLKPFHQKSEEDKRETDTEELLMYLTGIRDAVEGFDLDGADSAMAKLEECRLPECVQQMMENLRVYIADVAMEEIVRIVDEMMVLIREEKGGRKPWLMF
jgi:CheY-like chemotaxis protein/nitrogen-specific signal transduction histidine kinase/HPt (histidine-containing phosphotransfer) domain-containing protein